MYSVDAQEAKLYGKVYDLSTHEAIPNANIRILNTEVGTSSDKEGSFEMLLEPGLYNLEISHTGYEVLRIFEIELSSARPIRIEAEMKVLLVQLGAVEVSAEDFRASPESPLGLSSMSNFELIRMPGATLDISKFIRTMPGVSTRTSFGYNMVVRGGAPYENKFFLDGMEIPSLTHFTVQGTSGGPNGILNPKMVRNMTVHSSAFPAARPDALSAVVDVQQIEGRKDRWGGNLTLGATDFGFLVEGPLGKKASVMFSARESFSQHLLDALGIPVIPFYSDAQLNTVIRLNEKNTLSIIGLGGFDRYTLNLDAEESDALLYNIGYIPEGTLGQYMFGTVYKHYLKNSYYSVSASQNGFINKADKFYDNIAEEANRSLEYKSSETESHFKLEHRIFKKDLEYSYGINMESDRINTLSYSILSRGPGMVDSTNYQIQLNFVRYGAYANYSNRLLSNRLTMFFGMRLDANSYSDNMKNPLQQFSPRASLTWTAANNWQYSLQAGRYFQMPPYLLMGYVENGSFANRDALKYIRSDQVSVGLAHTTKRGYKLKVEGFYKEYSDYPFLLEDSISYANANASYVQVGNQRANSASAGRVYGIDVQAKQKLKNNAFWTINYSFVVSEFDDAKGSLISSAWDNRHFGNVIFGKRFGKLWQFSARWSYSAGNPYTPYDVSTSSLQSVWNINRKGIPNFAELNEERLPAFHQLDLRIDKSFNFRKWALTAFLDVQNVYSNPIALIPYLTLNRDEFGDPVIDQNDPSRYSTQIINSDTGRILPTLGLIFDL